MVDVTGIPVPTGASPFRVPEDMKAMADRIGAPEMFAVATTGALPTSGNWAGRILTVQDTGAVYVWLGAWRMISRPSIFWKVLRDASGAFDFTNAWTLMQWDTGVSDGALGGFTTKDWRTFTCTVPGVYSVSAQITASGGAGSIQAQVKKSGVAQIFPLAAAAAGTFVSVGAAGPVRFTVGDTLAVERFASSKIAGVAGTATYLIVDWMHA